MDAVLAADSYSRGGFSTCLAGSAMCVMVPGGSTFHLEPGTIQHLILNIENSFKNDSKSFLSFYILYVMNSIIYLKKVTNWDFTLCLLASFQFLNYDQLFINWWYLYILVYTFFISSSINIFYIIQPTQNDQYLPWQDQGIQ